MKNSLFTPEEQELLKQGIIPASRGETYVDPVLGVHENAQVADYRIGVKERDGIAYRQLSIWLTNLGNNGTSHSDWLNMRLPSAADRSTLSDGQRHFHDTKFMNFLNQTGLLGKKVDAAPHYESEEEMADLIRRLDMLKGKTVRVKITEKNDFKTVTFLS